MLIIILSGPSGVGKSTIVRAWELSDVRVRRVTTHTTRPPRAGEVPNHDYYFIDDKSFAVLSKEQAYLDECAIFGWRYGLTHSEVDRIKSLGLIPILEIDVTGGSRVVKQLPDAVTIFLLPPTVETLRERLRKRGSESGAAIDVRLKHAQDEVQLGAAYKYQVVNSDLQSATAELRTIVDKEIMVDH